ncbi:MAG TPA: PadR family transcriptional regulator [Gemmatimonadaceae bacterium]|nr:PadR family transcriptional regulator [Gemmatimonadaceae bacterium]
MGDFWGNAGPRARGWRARAGRIFEHGDLKYVVLRLVAEKPRHGYEIIKELEDRFGGAYAPSPGTVYPTLTMLEDLGYVRAMPEEGGRKIYEITEEGRKHLAEHSSTVDSIFERIARFVDGFLDSPMMEVNQSFKRLGRATYSLATGRTGDRELLARIRAALDRASAEIEDLARTRGAGGAGGAAGGGTGAGGTSPSGGSPSGAAGTDPESTI